MYLKEKKESNNSSSAKEELQDAILEGLKKLPPLWQFVFNLREIEGYSYKEIAKIANIRIGTVKSILNRSKNKLREFLKDKCY
jgi:RNA polymerase sigma-70 factor (ECF subfamily)